MSEDAPDLSAPAPAPSEEDVDAARKRVFESLPPEVQAQPHVRARFGLGDAVEVLARPVARALGLTNCGGCKDRQRRLNDLGERIAAGTRRVLRRGP